MFKVVWGMLINDELCYRALVQLTFNEVGTMLLEVQQELSVLRSQVKVLAKIQSVRACNADVRERVCKSKTKQEPPKGGEGGPLWN